MAKNLRSKIAESDTLIVHDVNETALKQFAEEVGGNVTVAKTVREVAENAVGGTPNRRKEQSDTSYILSGLVSMMRTISIMFMI